MLATVAILDALIFLFTQHHVCTKCCTQCDKRLNRYNSVQLSKDEVMAIVKVLLSRLDPNKKLSDRVWKEPCVDCSRKHGRPKSINGCKSQQL